jgi:hypothetical protein
MAEHTNQVRYELPLTSVADAAYTALASDRLIYMPTQTAARVVTLPLAASLPIGTRIWIEGGSGASGTNTISVARAGSDTINGATSNVAVVSAAWGRGSVINVSATAWKANAGG